MLNLISKRNILVKNGLPILTSPSAHIEEISLRNGNKDTFIKAILVFTRFNVFQP